MATDLPDTKYSLYASIEAEINLLFGQLVDRVNARRDQLVSRLKENWAEYDHRIRKKENTIKEVTKMRERMEIISIEDNTAVEIQRRSVIAFEEEIQSLQEKVDPPKLVFLGSLTEELLEQVDKLGELLECSELDSLPNRKANSIDYRNRKKAVLTIGTKGTKRGHFNYPSRIYVDEKARRLYVPDSENRRIQVMSTAGEYVSQFGQENMQFPVSIVTDRNFAYVSDNTQDCLLRYRLSDLAFVNRQSHCALKLPRGVAVSEAGEVMVADYNNRICVFNCELKFMEEFGRGQLEFPQSLQIRSDQIFVLDCGNPCLQIFNKKRERIRSIISRGFMKQVRDGVSFCLDHEENILIADRGAKRLKIFSPRGEAIHAIGDGLTETENIGICWGVAVAGTKIFVAGRSDNNHFVKVF